MVRGPKVRVDRASALIRANQLIRLLEPACEQIAVAGSIRREKPIIGDIELVAIPKIETVTIAGQNGMFDAGTAPQETELNRLDQRIQDLIAQEELYFVRPYSDEKGIDGPRQKKLWTFVTTGPRLLRQPVQVDLFVVRPPAQWGAILAIRTGPAEWNKALMSYIRYYTRWRQDAGRLVCQYTGIEAQTPTEDSYFRLLRLPVVPPYQRSEHWIRAKTRAMTKYSDTQGRRLRAFDERRARAYLRRRLEDRAGLYRPVSF